MIHIFLLNNLPRFQEIYPVFLQLKKNTFHFPKKLKLVNTFLERKDHYYQSNSKYVSLILSSFFKHHLQISFQIFNQNLNRVIKHNTSLLTRKGCYPYDYVSSIDKLKETKLPSKEAFYSKLYDEDISEEDYQRAIQVWNTFNCQSLQDYHDLYLKCDVLLLADVFENFRKTCLKHYKLDPCHYYTAPCLAWDACLKETKQDLELLKDYDMLMMFERGIRGGITHISKRYAEANNRYMKNYDENKPSTYIQYLDANNLYGWAMSQKLPTHGFNWIDINKSKVINLL